MNILITADLHYDISRSRGPAERLARRVADSGADVLALLGDTAGADTRIVRDALRLFAGFPGHKLLVPGNHGIWTTADGPDSSRKYFEILPRLAEDEGFHMLDTGPVQIGSVGFVGSMGWYDYGFRDASLAIPREFYARKMAPGAAAYLGHDDLIARHRDDLTDAHMKMGARWMDVRYARLGMSDEAFCGLLADRLAEQIDRIAPSVDRVVAMLHHLPFAELVPADRPARFAFAAAYMGSARLGQVLLAREKVTHVYCGHSHWPARVRVGHIEAVNVGSTYVDKRLELLTL